MLIAHVTSTNSIRGVLIGLSRKNVERLMSGQVIKINRESHGTLVPDNLEIAIMFGETEIAMHDELKSAGLVDERTKTHIDPRLKQ